MSNKRITEEELLKFLEELTIEEIPNKREFIFYQGCKTHGTVIRSSKNLNICNDSECSSCNMMRKSLDDALKNYFKNGK